MQVPLERVPWSRDTSVFWRQQLFGVHCRVFRCPYCDYYLEGLWHDQDIAFHTHYCGLCKTLYFVSHAMSDWLWQRHDDHSFAVWFAVPCRLRSLRTPEGDKYMRGVWHEGV